MIAWVLIGVLAIVGIVAIVVGAIKSYTGIKSHGLPWVLACGVYLILVKALIENKVLSSLSLFDYLTDNATNFIVAVFVLCVVTFLLAGIFAAIAKGLKRSFNKQLKQAEKQKYAEAHGEEFEIDENKEYKPLPVDGKKPVRIINRVWGAISSAVCATAFTASIIALLMLVLYATPLRDTAFLAEVYTQGPMAEIWSFVHKYAFDFLMISFVMYMIRKGWEVGFMEGLRKLLVFFGFTAAVIGPFVLMFTAPTATGGKLAFLGRFATLISDAIGSNGAIPAVACTVIGKVCVGVILVIIACLLMALINWLLKKLVDLFDDVKILSAIEKSLATIVFFIFAISVLIVIVAIFYALGYYGVFDCRVLFKPYSPISSAFYGACEEWLKPLLVHIAELLAA
ncbi:MAG: hypothetical protein IJY11_03395 [Clostridia bacterium]|nr:hypothetical protein [Clostridia bacterium]